MPYADPEKRKANTVKKVAAFKARERAKKLSGEEAGGKKLPAGTSFSSIPPAPGFPGAAPPPVAGPSADRAAEVQPRNEKGEQHSTRVLTKKAWTGQKILYGRLLCEAAVTSLKVALAGERQGPIGPRDCAVMLRLGVELVNANLEEMPLDEAGPKTYNMELMADATYRELAEAALVRQAELILQME